MNESTGENQAREDKVTTEQKPLTIETVSAVFAVQKRDWPLTLPMVAWGSVKPELQTRICQAVCDREWPITLLGKPGTGKTFAMATVYTGWPAGASRPVWFRAHDLLEILMEAKRSGGFVEWEVRRGDKIFYRDYGYQSTLSEIANASLLCLDDLGMRSLSSSQFEAFMAVLDLRVGKPTIYTTNHDEHGIAQLFDQRVASRLFCGRPIELIGPDQRLIGKKIITVHT